MAGCGRGSRGSRASRALLLVLCLTIATFQIIGCRREGPLRTIDGPEDDTLLQGLSGTTIVSSSEHGGVLAVSLLDLTHRLLIASPDWKRRITVNTVAGPDQTGQILYVLKHHEPSRMTLHWMSVDGANDQEISETPANNAILGDLSRDPIVLAPSGRRMAFVEGSLRGYQVTKQGRDVAYFREGALRVWDLVTRQPIEVQVTAVDDLGLSWLPSGFRLAYSALVLRAQLPPDALVELKGSEFDEAERVPAVMVLDLASGRSEFLHTGSHPIVSPDGRRVLTQDLHYRDLAVRLADRTVESVMLPGRTWGGAVAFVSKERVLYKSLPTTGSREMKTRFGSPLVGPHRMIALKIADLRTGKFKTVFAPMDPRARVTYGAPGSGL